MAYDHHLKAGNQGDCVKHPPLIAALDEVLNLQSSRTDQGSFHYLDVFSGHAWHPLPDDKKYEWRNGIGQLALTGLPNHVPHSVATWWSLWQAAPEWPRTNPAGYPGSAWIAADRCRKANRSVKLELYDHSEEARCDLERTFPVSHPIQDTSLNSCLIAKSLELNEAKQEQIVAADFVFFDPPGWYSDKQTEYPKWEDTVAHVLKPRWEKPTLMWMPTAGNDRVFDGQPSKKIREAADAGYKWTAVRWQIAGAEACVLVYNCAVKPIQDAINSIAEMAKWGKVNKTFEAVRHS